MNYWLIKSEPDTFSFDTLKKQAPKAEHWDGVRNYQARNFMQSMQVKDAIFFYHSNCATPGIVGIASVARQAYPDFTAWDPSSHYYDPTCSAEKPRWYMVDVQYTRPLKRLISLTELKQQPQLQDFRLVQKGNRLSVMPVSKTHWDFILEL